MINVDSLHKDDSPTNLKMISQNSPALCSQLLSYSSLECGFLTEDIVPFIKMRT